MDSKKIQDYTSGHDKPEFKRWSAVRKAEIIIRFMKGETLDALSREAGIPASQIEEWYLLSIKGIETSLKSRLGEPLQAELDLAKKRIGELSMENELLKERSRKKGVFLGGKWKR
jgi:transposase